MKPRWMHFRSLLIAAFLVFFSGLQAQNYEQEFKTIDSLSRLRLPESALKETESLMAKIRKDKNNKNQTALLVKTLIQLNTFQKQLEEDGLAKAIYRFQQEMEQSKGVTKAILQSMLAEFYYQYLQNHSYKFQDRTAVVDYKPEDIGTWDIPTLTDRIFELHHAALKHPEPRKVKLEDYQTILSNSKYDTELQPTLYDLLMNRALGFFKSSSSYLTEPVYKFYIDNKFALADANTFLHYQFKAKDSLSKKFQVLVLFQDYLRFHQNDRDPVAFVNADYRRLNWVFENCIIADKERLYQKALNNIAKKYAEKDIAAEALYYLASIPMKKGYQYKPNPDDTYRWKLKEAREQFQKIVDKYPKSYGAIQAKAAISGIEAKNVSASTEDIWSIDQTALAKLSYRNISKAHFRLIKVTKAIENKISKLQYKRDELVAYFSDLPSLNNWSMELTNEGDFQTHSVEFKIPGQKAGEYLLLVSNQEDFGYQENGLGYLYYTVSDISFSERKRDGIFEYYVTDRRTGEPLEGVKVEFFMNKYNSLLRRYENRKVGQDFTNKKGYVQTNAASKKNYYSFYVKFSKEEDVLDVSRSYYNYEYDDRPKPTMNTTFFLDRAIYRPGQTVYFKGIIIQRDQEGTPSIRPNYSTTVVFYDANRQEVAKLEVKSNEYGTYQGSFTAPSSGLLGQMHIRDLNTNSNKYFRVEEYKRPKFEVSFLPVKESFQLEQKATVKGEAKAYAGSNIDGAKVQYRVVRKVSFPWRPYWYRGWNPWARSQQEIAFGETTTDENGQYEITFEAIADKSIPRKQNPQFTYTVYADVTDITGETHSSQSTVTVGYLGLKASVNIPSDVLREGRDTFSISTVNLNGEFEPAQGQIKISKLKTPAFVYNSRRWDSPDYFKMKAVEFTEAFPNYEYEGKEKIEDWEIEKEVFSLYFNSESSKDLPLTNLGNWEQGAYKLVLNTKDKFNNPIEFTKYFTVYSKKESKTPTNEALFVADRYLTAQPGETVTIDFGSFDENAYIFFEVEHDNELIRSEWIQAKERQNIELQVEEKHRGNFHFHVSTTLNNRFYQQTGTISVPWTNKQLTVEYGTFRDKLKPGQEEEWKIKISGPKKDKVAAEVLASMYDASLDAFAANNWYFSLFGSNYARLQLRGTYGFSYRNTSLIKGNNWYETYSGTSHRYAALNWFGFSFYDYGGYGYYADDVATGAVAVEEAERSMSRTRNGRGGVPPPPPPAPKADKALNFKTEAKDPEPEAPNDTTAPGGDLDQDAGETDFGDVKVRTNLNETVFFFPNLQTDEEGNVIIKFTMNEALTRWKFQLLAHTKELQTTTSSKEVVTQKDLMVMPNAPRFFRQSDEIYFTAKVSNMTKEVMKGKAVLQLFDALSMKPVDDQFGNAKAELAFEAKGGQSAPLIWKLDIPADWTSAVVYRVIAKAGDFSDGEENALPVLSNRMLVTETMPLPIRGGQSKTFEFKRMAEVSKSSTMKHHKYTLEFTPNPAWYAIQSLPYLMEYPYECTEQIFSRYYANSLATEVANSHPKVKRVFEQWRDVDPKALESKLMKNQELKYALIEETPWVLNAQSEEQQKRNLGVLFDLNRMSNELAQARDKMADRQLANGGFSWFPGGRDSWYITQYIVEGMGHLNELGVKDIKEDRKSSQMLQKAVSYIDQELALYYDRIVRNALRSDDREAYLAKDHLGQMAVHYLYARSFFLDQKVQNKKTKEAIEYFEGQAKKYALDKSDYMQGLLALALHRKGEDMDTPKKIVKSLKERALKDEEMGMYWKYPHGFYWYQLPIETHSLMIEVFDVVADDAQAVDDLKTYLLKAKQTTHWKTTKATASACYALLRRGDNWLMEDQEVKITLGKKVLDQSKIQKEAGTGYFKTSWDGKEIKNDMATVKVENPNKNVAWGAVYWQYFEELDKITHFKETPLKINKKLYKEVKTDRGPVLKEITDKTKLTPGDLVKVRVEIKVDRDMEYVHMKDQRASGFEPVNVISTYKYQGGLGYYESTRDASTNFFFSYLSKGTYVFEYPLRVNHKGDFSNGITTIQCMYAPEFTAHSEGVRVKIE